MSSGTSSNAKPYAGYYDSKYHVDTFTVEKAAVPHHIISTCLLLIVVLDTRAVLRSQRYCRFCIRYHCHPSDPAASRRILPDTTTPDHCHDVWGLYLRHLDGPCTLLLALWVSLRDTPSRPSASTKASKTQIKKIQTQCRCYKRITSTTNAGPRSS